MVIRNTTPSANGGDIEVLRASGLFDVAWFATRNPDLHAKGVDGLLHFHLHGWRENRWPNAYFEPDGYRRRYPDVVEDGCDPLLHYIRYGEAEGRRPVPYFDPVWYRRAHDVSPDELCLAHFLRHRHTGAVSPVEAFDAAYYLRMSPDVAAARMDPFEHYLVQGYKEDRRPSADFDAASYRARHMEGRAENPLLHFLQHQNRERPATNGADLLREHARFTRPGPGFEAVEPLPPGVRPQATVLAFYLPQFHPVPENDQAWGDGFTEWTNVGRAMPRFAGHYQPRMPRDLGHYRLEGTSTLRRQWALARGAGLGGFVFYYYRFGDRRVLEAPVEALLADPGADVPFCLMWANENWTRRWDGSEHEILLAQEHREEDEAALVDDLLRHMRDRRYIRLGGRPLLMVYRIDIVPGAAAAVSRWRALFRAGGEDPVLVMGQTFGNFDPRPYGLDAAVEFPPHKLGDALPDIRHSVSALDPGMTTRVHDYEALLRVSLDEPAPPFPLVRTVVPGWDNEARRPGRGTVFHGATPALYGTWLDGTLAFAERHKVNGATLMCVNAWNEWAEGAYLEPDQHWGAAFLNATGRALARHARPASAQRVLLVGHDAFPAGAQLLLLSLGRHLKAAHGLDVVFALLDGGRLLDRFRAVAPTVVAPAAELARALRPLGIGPAAAVVNSAAAAEAGPVLAGCGIPFVLLAHEMPALLRARNLVEPLQEAALLARCTVFAAPHVRDRVQELVQLDPGRTTVLPQGIYAPPTAGPARAAALRKRLRLPPEAALVVGMGYADLRKGFDLFLQVWRTAAGGRTGQPAPHFLWVGDMDPGLAASLGMEVAIAEASGTFHRLPFEDGAADWFAAASVLLLTSREDPFPTVVLEAMHAGVPTVAFDETGGIPDLLRATGAGTPVPLADVQAAARAVRRLLRNWTHADRRRVSAAARDRFGFASYAASVLRLALPDLPDVSVAVPSFNYARFMPERLRSVFAQTTPVREVLLLDDASSDDSVAVARAEAERAGRTVAVSVSARPGGVWAQWRRAAERASGEWLWIAEADDGCEPDLLGRLAPVLDDAVVLAFTDSLPVDENGQKAGDPYCGYYGSAGLAELAAGGTWDGAAFVSRFLAERNTILNASAVLWRRTALLRAFERCEEDLGQFRVAGDWRLYVEALLAPGARAAFVPEPLNRHRRHPGSVTGSLPHGRHLGEIEAMHRLLAARLRTTGLLTPGLRAQQRRYRAEAARALAAAAADSRQG